MIPGFSQRAIATVHCGAPLDRSSQHRVKADLGVFLDQKISTIPLASPSSLHVSFTASVQSLFNPVKWDQGGQPQSISTLTHFTQHLSIAAAAAASVQSAYR